MTVSNVVSPTGLWSQNATTSWQVSLRGINAWDDATCQSAAHFANDERQDGDDVNPRGVWTDWSFAAKTDGEWETKTEGHWDPTTGDWEPGTDEFRFVPLSGVSARCTLSRRLYLGRRYYRQTISQDKLGSATFARGGCPVYDYSAGQLTIDCRPSRQSGFASWRLPLRSSDRVRSTRAERPGGWSVT
jgi:hypothetical protein